MKLRYLLILTGMLSAGFTSAASYATEGSSFILENVTMVTYLQLMVCAFILPVIRRTFRN